MLQLPHTSTMAEVSAVLPEPSVLPSDIPSLIAMFREANAKVTAAEGAHADVMNAACERCEPIYLALRKAVARTPQEEAQRLSCVADYCKEVGLRSDLDGYFDATDLYRVAESLNRLTDTSGSESLALIDKSVQSMKRFRKPGLTAELDRLERDNDAFGMVALYDYCVSVAEVYSTIANQPRAASIQDFLEADSSHFWARAYAVADRLKKIRPESSNERDFVSRALVSAAFAMGYTIRQVADIARTLSERE